MKEKTHLTAATSDEQIISLWLSGHSKNTQLTYRRTVRAFLDFVEKPLADLTLDDLALWVKSLGLRYTINSVKLKLSVIKSLFSYAWKVDYLELNPAKVIPTPGGVDARHERFLEQEEVRKLIAGAREGRDRCLLSLIYATGLRASEALGIDWKDLKPRANGGQVTVTGKGGKVRTVLVGESLWLSLQSLKGESETEAVFVTSTGNRLDRHKLHRLIKAAAERAGVNPHVSAHWLRHAHACHSLENGCDIDVLMRSLGHSSLTVTSKYLHARPNEGSSQFIQLD
jgi:integrase/recombinase XerD